MFHWIKRWFHNRAMNKKIRAILAYNRAHPEECFNLEDYIKQPLQRRGEDW